MADWVVWVVVAGVLLVAEALTLTFFLGVLAVAALLSAAAALAGVPLAGQLLVAAVAGVAGVVAVRPIALRHRRPDPNSPRTGMAALEGATGLVTVEIGPTGGRVKLRGEEWSARAQDPALAIPAGATVHVAHIDGATAVVYPSV